MSKQLSDGNMSVVEVDYSLLNRQPEADFLPFCREKNLGVLVRGPLFRGMLSGKYDLDTVFTDSVRCDWNKGGQKRGEYEAKIDKVERLKKAETGIDRPHAKRSHAHVGSAGWSDPAFMTPVSSLNYSLEVNNSG